jgi:hypothetical protein
MDKKLPDIWNIAVPCEDRQIEVALVDLDNKLTAFVAAMQAIGSRLSLIAEAHEAAAETGARRRTKGRPAAAARDAKPEPKETPPVPQTEAAQAPVQGAGDVPGGPAADGGVPAPSKPPKQVVQVPNEPAAAKADQTPQEDAAPEAESDDEVLLASLDEATSKAIRVMRRLEPNKPVKELLKRIEERKDQPGQAAKPASKSWFKRG